MIVEYKNHLLGSVSVQPDFIISGGFFFDPINKTYVGIIEEDRDYWIPDTLVELSNKEVLDRALSIHSTQPFTIIDVESQNGMRNMTDEEVVNQVEDFLSSI